MKQPPFHALATSLFALAAPAWAQSASPPLAPTAIGAPDQAVDEEEEEGETIVVQGTKPRGSVVGDVPAENVLTSRDVRATGATSISELLDSIAAQTGSARGRGNGAPVLLLDGQRISGFRELRDLPPEAIERMEILPEEVALKYGYSADQRVVNIVLRRRFHSTSAEAGGVVATDGGYATGKADATRLIIADGARTSLNLHAEGNSALTEAERHLVLQPIAPLTDAVDPRPYRTLVGSGGTVRATGTLNRTIGDRISATVTGEADRTSGRSLFGVPTGVLTATDGSRVIRAFPGDPLTRDSDSESYALGVALNTQRGKWRLSSTANASLDLAHSGADRGPDLGTAQAAVDTGTDPLGDLGPLIDLPRDHSRSNRRALAIDGVANGPLFDLPAGSANATIKVGASTLDLDSRATRRGVPTRTELGRDIGQGSVNLDLPLAKRGSKLGRLGANFNAGVSQLSDFGTLTSLGAGLNWAPVARLTLIGSVTREKGAPTLQALGDPLLESANVPFFDATTGQAVDVTTLTGGNPALEADRRTVWKLGGNWQPWDKTDLRLRADWVHEAIDRPQVSFPAATPALEAAFPDRFQRDASGELIRVDLRPVNAERSTRNTLRLGFDFTKPLKSAPPSAATIAALRAQFAANRPAGDRPAPDTPPRDGPGGGDDTRGARGFGGGGGPRGGGGGFGGRNGGRLTLSATDTITLTDRLTIAPGLPALDYLGGEALGASGGRPRHQLEVQGGYFNNGLGARATANWRSATRVDGGLGRNDLRFSDYATVNLRLFANFGQMPALTVKHPFLRGSSLRLDLTNLFDSKPGVRGGDGGIPFAYQPDRLEPIGRTVGISFRKLFLPARFSGGGGRRGGAD